MSSANRLNDNTISQLEEIFKHRKDKTLLWDKQKPYLPNGKKNQYAKNYAPNLTTHISGEQLQGVYPQLEDGKIKLCFLDFDDLTEQQKDPKKFVQDVWNIDYQLRPCISPSGKYHVYKFFHNPVEINEAASIAEDLIKKFNARGYKEDASATIPKKDSEGLGRAFNLPFNKEQQFLSPRGKPITEEQFIQQYRFQKHPLIIAAAGLNEKDKASRHMSIFIIAGYLEKHGLFDHFNSIVDNLGSPLDDDKFLKRITEKEQHLKYDVGAKSVNEYIEKICEFTPEEKVDVNETLNDEPLDLEEFTGQEKLMAREWVIHGWILKKALTLVIGQAGVGKTIFNIQLAVSLAYGNKILGREVLDRGNVLILASEETRNELRIRIKAALQHLEVKDDKKHKIYIRGLEEQIKLVNFTQTDAKKTTDYKRLVLAIKKYKIKYIILDPLISFQTGAYDENNNAKMEQYVKDYLIPLAVENDGAVIAGHHTNKFSMISIQDRELLVDHQVALNSARGASSLVAAARFVLAMQPMTRKLFDEFFKAHITDGSTFTHYAGLIEAKSNYNVVEDDISWLKKQEVTLDVYDESNNAVVEKLGVFSTTDLNKISKAKNKLKAIANEEWAKSKISIIKGLMKDNECTLNKAVEVLAPMEDDFSDDKVDEGTIKTRVRRKLENGLNGKVDHKNGATAQGVSHDDGFNYWIKRDHTKAGAAKVFIQRGKDFSK